MVPSPGPPALEFEGFGMAVQRSGREQVLLEGVDLQVAAGAFYLLVGESGSGKSTLLRMVTGLQEPRETPPRIQGDLTVLGSSVRGRFPTVLRRRVSAILQEEGLLDEMSPRANVEMALHAAGRSPKLALGLLSQVGLEPCPHHVAQLSGGMRKRLAVARAMAAEPDLLFCDEPIVGLDAEAGEKMAQLLVESHRMAAGSRTTIVITHDTRPFGNQIDGVLVLDSKARSLSLGSPRMVIAEPVQSVTAEVEVWEDPALRGARHTLLALGGITQTLVETVVSLPPVELRQVRQTTARYMVESALFVIVASAAIGGLASFFALRNNPLQGAFTNAVLTGAGKVLLSVLIPLLAGLFFTARIAAGAAARLGTMKRTHQISALSLMGIRPADYLLSPLVWGMTLAMPVITAAGMVGASVTSLLAARLVIGTSTVGWASAFFDSVEKGDLRFVLWKSVISGFLVAVVTYHLATGPKRSGRDVGEAVNSSIVLGMVVVLVVHSLFTLWQFS